MGAGREYAKVKVMVKEYWKEIGRWPKAKRKMTRTV